VFVRGSDGYRDRENSQWGVNPGVRFVRPSGFVAVVNYERLRSEFIPDIGLPLVNGAVPDVSREANYQTPFDFSEQDVDRVRVHLEKKVGERTTLKNLAYYTRLDWKTDGTLFVGSFVDPRAGGAVTARTLTLLADEQQLAGNRLWFETSRSAGSSTHRLTAGLEAYRLADEYSLDVALLPAISITRPVETATLPHFLLPGFSVRADASNRALSAFAFDEATFGARVQALGGVRVDGFQFKENAYRIDKSWTKVSPFVGASVELSPGTRVFAGFSTGFSPASTLALGSKEPEKTRQFEGGCPVREPRRPFPRRRDRVRTHAQRHHDSRRIRPAPPHRRPAVSRPGTGDEPRSLALRSGAHVRLHRRDPDAIRGNGHRRVQPRDVPADPGDAQPLGQSLSLRAQAPGLAATARRPRAGRPRHRGLPRELGAVHL
jgi:hypothetical protein